MKTLNIKATFSTLAEAVAVAKPDLSYNEREARQYIARTDKQVTKAMVMEDDSIYYVYACDIDCLNKFEPFCHCISSAPFSLAVFRGEQIHILPDSIMKNALGRAFFRQHRGVAFAA
jgi:hypothetical protein